MTALTIQAHNAKAATTWGSPGRNYDRISQSIGDAIEHCVQRIAPQPGERVLDVATGTGWAARLMAQRGARVTGVDIAADLISAARSRADTERLTIDFEVGDAESLPFDDASFDAVVSTFGVMFAARPEAAAAELARVCRPGGRLGLATWPMDGTVHGLFNVMKPYMAAPPTPAPPSPFLWGGRERIRQLLGAEFDLRFETGTTVLREPSGAQVWQLFISSYGPTKALAASLDDVRRAQLERDFAAFHDGFASELGVAMVREYLVAVGTRR
jgi:SAM-dependent methyltransferase